MADILAFAAAHPFLAWSLAWGIWPIYWLAKAIVTTPFNFVLKAHNRHLRAGNIRAHGWPTNPLMDADGDIVYPPKEETNG